MKINPKVEGAETNFLKTITSEYEVISPQAVASVQILMDMRDKLGKPSTPFTPSGEKLMNIIIAVWEDGYSEEAKQWYEERKAYKKAELDITTQIRRRTGRSLASYPETIYNMMRKLFKGFEPAERNNCIKMVKKWPMFQLCNKV